ncbi:MAG TPA: nitroreductase/quinone reductase family protein [Acidimicrobiales bacterium]
MKTAFKQKVIGTLTVSFDRTLGRLSYPIHLRVYRLTRGFIGHRSPAGPMLILTSTGRKSGVERSNGLLYLEREGRYYIVASNGGRENNPNWLYNVRNEPRVKVQAASKRFDATAHVLDESERAVTWPTLTTFYPGWAHYETLTDRPLQVIRLDPIEFAFPSPPAETA